MKLLADQSGKNRRIIVLLVYSNTFGQIILVNLVAGRGEYCKSSKIAHSFQRMLQ